MFKVLTFVLQDFSLRRSIWMTSSCPWKFYRISYKKIESKCVCFQSALCLMMTALLLVLGCLHTHQWPIAASDKHTGQTLERWTIMCEILCFNKNKWYWLFQKQITCLATQKYIHIIVTSHCPLFLGCSWKYSNEFIIYYLFIQIKANIFV